MRADPAPLLCMSKFPAVDSIVPLLFSVGVLTLVEPPDTVTPPCTVTEDVLPEVNVTAPVPVTVLVRLIPAFESSTTLLPEVIAPPVIPFVVDAVVIETGFPVAVMVPLMAFTSIVTAPAPPLKFTVFVAFMLPVVFVMVLMEPALVELNVTLFPDRAEPAPRLRLRPLPAPLL